ncbi:hypothetical protein J6590_016536 [Homalodisca vitripennis]|nr:hypothetical protein J6590_016536 [Homalodisca vitripennis]
MAMIVKIAAYAIFSSAVLVDIKDELTLWKLGGFSHVAMFVSTLGVYLYTQRGTISCKQHLSRPQITFEDLARDLMSEKYRSKIPLTIIASFGGPALLTKGEEHPLRWYLN